ncbi:uncharacterized protein F4807DRAFT_428790 [Annulohypoxylon truncatum]|uniref:uncharacterized protein n=1 Tax=Annulohypoxylon truncatum TaxID=327061 RepID=UPI002008EA09|nr:uncharacterized protein F4807DRAFT_428790 [Annulohypoxylon truncatum]KAI1209069.1 hypothetical protein F4807DRAFT_428790 [Annulohypoxylon truncatum]
MATPQQPLFGLLPAGQPLITTPTSQPLPSNFLYAIPHTLPPSPSNPNPKPFSHLCVFLLPGASTALPPGTAAGIYVALNPGALAAADGSDPRFQFLGGVGPGKESAVFKLSPSTSSSSAEGVVIGISVEEAGVVAEKIQQLHPGDPSASTSTTVVPHAGAGGGVGGGGQPSTQILAQRIIQNAFNFLSGFSGKVGAEGVEVVPLKAFQEWWRKFENKVRNDPAFLEREQD